MEGYDFKWVIWVLSWLEVGLGWFILSGYLIRVRKDGGISEKLRSVCWKGMGIFGLGIGGWEDES